MKSSSGRVDSLPEKIHVPLTNLQNVPVTAALEAVLAGTDVSLSYQGKDMNDRLVTLLNLSGPLPKVVQRICSAARIFCVAREGNLELKEEQSFVIELPPIERATSKATGGTTANSIVDAIARLAGSKAEADEAGGNLIYTTTVEGQERVSKYLEQLRNGRPPLVVVQMYIWEVSLDSEASRGINWKDLKISNFGGNTEKFGLTASEALSTVTGGVSLGGVERQGERNGRRQLPLDPGRCANAKQSPANLRVRLFGGISRWWHAQLCSVGPVRELDDGGQRHG